MTPAERNQVMGHSRNSIFEDFYQNHVVGTNIAAAVLKTPSRTSLLTSIDHIGIDRKYLLITLRYFRSIPQNHYNAI